MAGKAALVEEIKSLQRADPAAKQAWWDHCDQLLGGIRDPNRHEEENLYEFLAAYNAGQLAGVTAEPSAGRSKGGGRGKGSGKNGGYGGCAPGGFGPPPPRPSPYDGFGARPGHGFAYAFAAPGPPAYAPPPLASSLGLVEFVKIGQRKSQHWKEGWRSYCAAYGQGAVFDPARYDDAFIAGFIDFAGELASANLNGAVRETAPAAEPYAGRPAKRAPAGGAGLARAAPFLAPIPDVDAELQSLIVRVKALQRRDPETKQEWIAYTESLGGTFRDPARHTAEALEEFLASHE